jgi:hypothetical protein
MVRCQECDERPPDAGDVICSECKAKPFELPVLPPDALEGGGHSTPADPRATVPHSPPRIPDLARDQRILDRFKKAVRRRGVVGEEKTAATVYLSMTSRVQDDLTSAAVKGASSSGKSHTVQRTVEFFPPEAYIEMTAMSERALVYMKEDFKHRTLVIYEAVALREGIQENLTAYFVRSLLSEGQIKYPVTVKDKDGNHTTTTRVKEGPTNLILTTTETRLHRENETRLISMTTNDSPEQTRRVLRELASGGREPVDLRPWHDLQRWIERAEHRVVIPYAPALAEAIPLVAIRLRRDFTSVLALIRAHAILHQLNRPRDSEGRIVATSEDYDVVRELVAGALADGMEATVSPEVREAVQAVEALRPSHSDGVPILPVAQLLRLDKSPAARRLRRARDRGYVVNLEDRRGRHARYKPGEPLPEEVDVLPRTCPTATVPPAPEGKSPGQGDRGTVALGSGGMERIRNNGQVQAEGALQQAGLVEEDLPGIESAAYTEAQREEVRTTYQRLQRVYGEGSSTVRADIEEDGW